MIVVASTKWPECDCEPSDALLLAAIGLRCEAFRHPRKSDARSILQDASDALLATWRTSNFDYEIDEAQRVTNEESPGLWLDSTIDGYVDLTLPALIGTRWFMSQMVEILPSTPSTTIASAATALESVCKRRLKTLRRFHHSSSRAVVSMPNLNIAADDFTVEVIGWPPGRLLLHCITGAEHE